MSTVMNSLPGGDLAEPAVGERSAPPWTYPDAPIPELLATP